MIAVIFNLCRVLCALGVLVFIANTPSTGATIGSHQPATCPPNITLYNSDWGGGPLKDGVDYSNLTSYDAACPNGVTINWLYPFAKPTTAGVYGYLLIAWDQYDNGQPGLPAGSKRVDAIQALTISYSLSYYNAIGEYDQLTEAYLRDATGAKKVEAGYITHYGPLVASFLAGDKQLGTFTDKYGVAWRAVQHVGPEAPYITFTAPTGVDRPTGTLDFLGAFRWLQTKGLVDPSWYYSGLALGVEPIRGGGWLRVTSVSVDYR
jgi:hypothetical protein